jgi:hypothetical protein
MSVTYLFPAESTATPPRRAQAREAADDDLLLAPVPQLHHLAEAHDRLFKDVLVGGRRRQQRLPVAVEHQ